MDVGLQVMPREGFSWITNIVAHMDPCRSAPDQNPAGAAGARNSLGLTSCGELEMLKQRISDMKNAVGPQLERKAPPRGGVQPAQTCSWDTRSAPQEARPRLHTVQDDTHLRPVGHSVAPAHLYSDKENDTASTTFGDHLIRRSPERSEPTMSPSSRSKEKLEHCLW